MPNSQKSFTVQSLWIKSSFVLMFVSHFRFINIFFCYQEVIQVQIAPVRSFSRDHSKAWSDRPIANIFMILFFIILKNVFDAVPFLVEIMEQSAKQTLKSAIAQQSDLWAVHDDFLFAAYFTVQYCRHPYLRSQIMRSINQLYYKHQCPIWIHLKVCKGGVRDSEA